MEINKETLNSLEVGDFVKVRESDGWKEIKDLQRLNGNVVRIDVNDRNYIPNAYFKYILVSYYIADVVDIKKCNSTHIIMDNIQPDPNSWIRSLSGRLGNPWEFTEFDWKKSQEKIQKAMNKDLISSIDCAIFKSITERMLETYKKKNADYGSSFDKSMNEFGLMSAVVRMSDKMERLKSLVKKDAKVKDESVEDTLLDLANYCVMTVMHLKVNKDGNKD